jgi:hypothetical protein
MRSNYPLKNDKFWMLYECLGTEKKVSAEAQRQEAYTTLNWPPNRVGQQLNSPLSLPRTFQPLPARVRAPVPPPALSQQRFAWFVTTYGIARTLIPQTDLFTTLLEDKLPFSFRMTMQIAL